jgi:parallel beta-helix repeat protein
VPERQLQVVLCCLLAAVLGVFAPPAAATHVACGDVITRDTTLDSDLLGCPGPGVVIGAPGVTLDLRGHTIAAAEGSQGQSGVDNSAGHDGVTVTHGTITGFFAAVRYAGADDGRVSRLDASTQFVWLSDSDRNLVERSDVAGQIFISGESDDNVIHRNTVTGGGNGVFLLALAQSLPHRNLVEHNVISGAFNGVSALGAVATTIAGNRITGSVGSGIANRSGGTLIEDNHVARNGFGDALNEPASGIITFNADDATIRRNHVTRNAVDGIALALSARGNNVVEDNKTHRNGDDGIDVDQQIFGAPAQSVTVTANKAHHNGDLGLEAVPGVTDGGRNKAHGNGNPLQCLNVSCK